MTLTTDPGFAPTMPAAAPKTKAFETDRTAEAIVWAVPIVLLALVLKVQTWGLVALTMTALCLVPLMFAFFIYICWPFPARR